MKGGMKTAAFVAFVALIIAWAVGAFRSKGVEPGRAALAAGPPAPSRTATVDRGEVPVREDAVGTVRSRTQVAIAAQVPARVLRVAAEAGSEVREGDELVRLDDREWAVRVAQAKEALAAAQAARASAEQAKASAEALLAQSKARYDRVKGFLAQKAATPEQMEQAEAGYLQAQAGVAEAEAAILAAGARIEQARQGVTEAEIALGHCTIRAPGPGVVAERSVEPGDLAWGGRVLLVLLDPSALRLEAQVREGLIGLVAKGASFPIEFPSLGRTVEGRVAEVIPAADPVSRTFRVRVDFDPFPGIHVGMFGRLRLPVGTREIVRLPAAAIERVGQLETVIVRGERGWERRLVTTGAAAGEGLLEALSGLRGGETVGLREEGR